MKVLKALVLLSLIVVAANAQVLKPGTTVSQTQANGPKATKKVVVAPLKPEVKLNMVKDLMKAREPSLALTAYATWTLGGPVNLSVAYGFTIDATNHLGFAHSSYVDSGQGTALFDETCNYLKPCGVDIVFNAPVDGYYVFDFLTSNYDYSNPYLNRVLSFGELAPSGEIKRSLPSGA
jgi:hypothetical protein